MAESDPAIAFEIDVDLSNKVLLRVNDYSNVQVENMMT